MTEKFTEADPTGAKRFLAALPQAYNEPGHRRTGHGPNPRAETIAADPENKWAMNQTLEVWPESHWPGFALREADVFKTYMAWWCM